VGDVLSPPILITCPTSPPSYSTVATYFVPSVKVILSAPEKVKSSKVALPSNVVTSTASEVAKALPVGTLDVPYVPE